MTPTCIVHAYYVQERITLHGTLFPLLQRLYLVRYIVDTVGVLRLQRRPTATRGRAQSLQTHRPHGGGSRSNRVIRSIDLTMW